MRAQQRAPLPTAVFDGVTVVDVERGTLRPAQRVVIAGNRIQVVGAASAVKLPKGAQVIDAKGKYLIPGLWDMHTHLWRYPEVFYSLQLANGVTGIRDVGTGVLLDTLRRWREEVLGGARVGPPRQFFAGPMLDEAAIEPDCRYMCFQGRMPYFSVPTPARARIVVDSLHAEGADFIKVHSITSPDVYYAIVNEARRIGIPFAGHLPGDGKGVSILEASDSGQRTIEHLQGLDSTCLGEGASVEKCRPIAAHMAKRGAWNVLGPSWRSSRETERVRRSRLRYWPDSATSMFDVPADSVLDRVSPRAGLHLEVLERAGLPMLVGTDQGAPTTLGVPGFALHDDMAFYADEGLTPLAVLRAATINAAEALGVADSLGTVEAGKLADLVLLDADPLADIYNTTKIRAVIANGRYFDRAALDGLLAELERHGAPRWAALVSAPAPGR